MFKWRHQRTHHRDDLTWTDHQRHRRIGQATDNTRHEEGSSADEATKRLHRSPHRHTDTRTTEEHHTEQMGSTQQRNRGASTHSSKRVYRTRHRHWQHLRKHTNLQCTQTTLNTEFKQQLDSTNGRHFGSIPTRSSSNRRSPHASTNRVLQQSRRNRLEAQQSNLRLEKLTKSMANTLSRRTTAAWSTAVNSRTQHLLHAAAQRLHPGLRGRSTSSWRRGNSQQDLRSNNTFYFDQQELWQWETQCPFSDATSPTEETTTNLDWQIATTTHFLRKQRWRTASQQQHQEHQHWRHQQQTMTNHWVKTNTKHSDERSANYSGWHTQDPTFATQQKNLHEHCSSQHHRTSRSSNIYYDTSEEQHTTNKLYDQRLSWHRQHMTSTFTLTAIGQDV